MIAFAKHASLCREFQWRFSSSRNTILGFLAIAVAMLLVGRVEAAGRVALLLAGEEYTALGKSPVPVRQLTELSEGLRRHGFEVVVSTNPSNAVARATLRDFSSKVENADVALIVVAGHTATSNGRTYFLPVNSEITRETDFLSRGLAVDSFVQIASRARISIVSFLMTIPNLPPAVQSVSPRPVYPDPMPKGSVLVFSSSDKVPVSRVDKVSQQALLDLLDLVREPRLPVSAIVNAASAGGVGRVMGDVTETDLAKYSSAPQPPPVPPAQSAESDRRLRQAEERAQQAEDRARQAEAKARLEAQRAAELAAQPKAGVMPLSQLQPAEPAPPETDTAALQLVEAMLGRPERRNIQVKLAKLEFYKGPLDAIFGDLTRQAIRDYQRSIGADSTGYLTPQQLQTLMK
jgi:hypothetical protein